MKSSFKNVINLIKRTGDRCVVLDENGEDAYVVMPLKDYETMVLGNTDISNLTEEEFLDKINRDIAVWKSQQEIEKIGKQSEKEFKEDLSNISQNYNNSFSETQNDQFEDEPFYFEKI